MTWRNIIVPWQPPGPVVIDLAPAPAAPAGASNWARASSRSTAELIVAALAALPFSS